MGCSWVAWIALAIVVFTQLPEGISATGHFITCIVISSIVFIWFCYESYKLSCKMQPDEYMKGVIYFYTDMFYVCACCALLACLGGGGGQGAPPKDEEER